jgi:hypothetical protein
LTVQIIRYHVALAITAVGLALVAFARWIGPTPAIAARIREGA